MLRAGLVVLLLSLVLNCDAALVATKTAAEFLEHYGYIKPARLTAAGGSGEPEDPKIQMENAIKAFQQTADLIVNGQLDESTRREMDADRCGVADLTSDGTGPKVWKKSHLTYSIDNKFEGMTAEEVQKAIKKAFALYSEAAPLTFEEVDKGEGDIRFSFGSGDHGLCDAFDGRGHAIAHAFYPSVGKIHFDADEPWVVMRQEHLGQAMDETYRVDFLTVAAHQIGHVLGLHHDRGYPLAIMAPRYRHPETKKGEHREPWLEGLARDQLRNLYGTFREPKILDKVEETSCGKDVYGALELPYDQVMIFPDKGHRVLEIALPSKRILQNVPVSEIFTSGPSQVMAAYYRDSMIMLFHGDQVWGYKLSPKTFRFDLAVGYPKKLPVEAGWQTDAAFPMDPETILVNRDKQVVAYDERSNEIELLGPISERMPNFPEDGVGSAKFSKEEKLIYFTKSRIFSHDFKEEATKDLGTINEFLDC